MKNIMRLCAVITASLLTVGFAFAQSPQGDKVDLAKAKQPDTLKVLFVGNSYRQWQTWAPPESKGMGKVTDEEAADLQRLAWKAVLHYSNDPHFIELRKKERSES